MEFDAGDATSGLPVAAGWIPLLAAVALGSITDGDAGSGCPALPPGTVPFDAGTVALGFVAF